MALVRLPLLLALALLSFSCGPADVGERCEKNEDCAPGLVCAARKCPLTANADCSNRCAAPPAP